MTSTEAQLEANQLFEVLVPMEFEHPVGSSIEEWRENIHKTELYKRGDTVLIWVNEGDICCGPWGPFVKRLLKSHENDALTRPPADPDILAAVREAREALNEIADLTRRQQLPITSQINGRARAALTRLDAILGSKGEDDAG